MSESNERASDFLATFSRHRQQLLHHAGSILTAASVPVAADGRVPHADATAPGAATSREFVDTLTRLTQLLVTSLEALRAAEEEMLEQHLEITATRIEMERTVAYYRVLFDLAPAALLLTTPDGTIRASNAAAGALLLRDAYHLDGRPMSGLVARRARDEFRQQLGRLLVTEGATNWCFTVDRPTDAPVEVSAAVNVVNAGGAKALHWTLRALGESPAARVEQSA